MIKTTLFEVEHFKDSVNANNFKIIISIFNLTIYKIIIKFDEF